LKTLLNFLEFYQKRLTVVFALLTPSFRPGGYDWILVYTTFIAKNPNFFRENAQKFQYNAYTLNSTAGEFLDNTKKHVLLLCLHSLSHTAIACFDHSEPIQL